MTRISKREAFKRFVAGKAFLVCPCLLRPDGPFSPAYNCVSGKEWMEKAEGYRDNPKLWAGTVETTAWELMYNNWKHYNASREAGYYARYYIES